MATVRKIDEIRPIPGADAIECAVVGGWTCVVKKDEFTAGDLAVYCEIDSFIPTEIAPFLTRAGHHAKTFEGIQGERLRTVKLRGQLSQGLLLPLNTKELPNATIHYITSGGVRHPVYQGDDVSELLGILKYEAPVPAQLAGEVRGNFPSRIPKTDQERIQNLKRELEQWMQDGLTFEVTEKLDGSSMTVYCLDGEFGVCSRNLDLKYNLDNTFWSVALAYKLDNVLMAVGNKAIQGELVGPGIQGNKYKLTHPQFFVYDIYDVDAGRYFTPQQRMEFCDTWDIAHCPVITSSLNVAGAYGEWITDFPIERMLAEAEGKSAICCDAEREGLVFKCNEREVSFKAISNKFLMRGGD
jgi:RNA ligase (TIGR02306 family)